MPSGRTHDRITLWSLPFVAGLTLGVTQSANLTLLVSSGFLFSGLMFGPDLDIHSRQYIRWGWLRWIWIPYQKILRHRSIFSHGPIVGTTLRVLYLGSWLGAIALLGLGIVRLLWGGVGNWQVVVTEIERSLFSYPAEWIALYLGLEWGGMSHSLSDWGGSAYKRFKSGKLRTKTKRQKRKLGQKAKTRVNRRLYKK